MFQGFSAVLGDKSNNIFQKANNTSQRENTKKKKKTFCLNNIFHYKNALI